jgi:hypothetical protein
MFHVYCIVCLRFYFETTYATLQGNLTKSTCSLAGGWLAVAALLGGFAARYCSLLLAARLMHR